MNPSRSRRHAVRLLLLLLVAAAAAFVGCSKDKRIMAPIVPVGTETISTPVVPSGDSVITPGAIYGATTGGASSSLGHSLEFRMDFDAGSGHRYSSWSSDSVTFQAWPVAGSYLVEAQARCATHPSVASAWSAGRRVTVAGPLQELISVPNIPSGDTAPVLGATASYSTGGAISYLGHALEYRFHFLRVDGDGTPSDVYSGWSSSTTSHTWPRCSGTFQVIAQARCAVHTDQVSQPSSPLTVRVTGSGAIVVISASIQFFHSPDDHDAGLPIYLSRALAPWSEGSVTWANKPALSASLGQGVRTAVDNDYLTGELVTFAIPLDVLQAWRDDPSSNYGLAVSDPNATSPGFDTDVDFYARRTGDGVEPTVSIVWQYPGEDCEHVKNIHLQQDAYVDESAPASNFGDTSPLLAGSLAGKERAIFVKFDPSLP